MRYSVPQAADVTGVNKSTVFRAIKGGKVSAARKQHDNWLIEPAELHRIYPAAAAGNEKIKRASDDAHQADLAEANQRAALAALEVSLVRATTEDLRSDRDSWREQAQRLALPAPANARSKLWWWRSRRSPEQGLAA
jgi:hypothetical protein